MGARILVVDDISSNLKLMQAILNKEDYTVLTAENGEKALDLAAEYLPDLILLDIMMPGQNGYEVCEKLKASEKTAPIPVIFLSARSEKNSVVKGLETGGQDYITKPFHAQEFLLRVRIHLELKEKTEQLEGMNQTLEEKVNGKTRELQDAYKRLEKLDLAKNNFLDLIAHELRTPLNGIMGVYQLLESTPMNSQQQKHLTRLRDSAERLSRFSEMALLITTISSADHEMETAPLRFVKTWQETVRSLEDRIAEKNLHLQEDIPRKIRPQAANGELVREVFLIILRNAVKYSPPGETIEAVMSRDTDGGPRGDTDGITLTVTDHGPGFSPEAREKLFRFFSTEDIEHHQSGLGLGLALAKMVMDAHGGTIAIRNREPQGAKVTLFFPAQNASGRNPSALNP